MNEETERDGRMLVQFYYVGGPRDGQPFERPGFLIPHTVEHRDWDGGYYEANAPLARFEWHPSKELP